MIMMIRVWVVGKDSKIIIIIIIVIVMAVMSDV